ncbi:hypothetical protein KC367_g165 [Hortaea werneckii]|nr:hypothetical protein KC367_g165 [Hortaea werneckii]
MTMSSLPCLEMVKEDDAAATAFAWCLTASWICTPFSTAMAFRISFLERPGSSEPSVRGSIEMMIFMLGHLGASLSRVGM